MSPVDQLVSADRKQDIEPSYKTSNPAPVSSSKSLPPLGPITFQKAPPDGNKMMKHGSQGETAH